MKKKNFIKTKDGFNFFGKISLVITDKHGLLCAMNKTFIYFTSKSSASYPRFLIALFVHGDSASNEIFDRCLIEEIRLSEIFLFETLLFGYIFPGILK